MIFEQEMLLECPKRGNELFRRGSKEWVNHVVAAGGVSPSVMPRGQVPREGVQAWHSARTWETVSLCRVRALFRDLFEDDVMRVWVNGGSTAYK